MELNAANRALLYQGYSAAFQKGLNHRAPQWNKLAMLVPSSSESNVYDWLKETFSIREWVGDRHKQNVAVADYQIKNKKFEGTVRINADKIRDRQGGAFGKLFEQMGNKVNLFPDKLVFGLLKAGFETPCWDGQYFFDTDHPVGLQGAETSVSNFMGGTGEAWYLVDSTQLMKPIIYQEREKFKMVRKDRNEDDNVFEQNELVYGVDGRCNAGYGLWQLCFASKQPVTVENVKAAITAMSNQKDDTGDPLDLNPDTVFCSPAIAEQFRDLYLKDLIAGETNTLKNRLQVISSGYLS